MLKLIILLGMCMRCIMKIELRLYALFHYNPKYEDIV